MKVGNVFHNGSRVNTVGSISAILLKTNAQRELKAELLLGSWSGAWEKQDRIATADSGELET